jgi:hypothetical protein
MRFRLGPGLTGNGTVGSKLTLTLTAEPGWSRLSGTIGDGSSSLALGTTNGAVPSHRAMNHRRLAVAPLVNMFHEKHR